VSERLLARRERFSAKRVLARIARERERLAALESLLRAADPRTALARGFSLTTDASGSLVRSVAQALPGTIVETRVVDGSFESVVRTTRRDGDG
jgi:exodeoxyribonuclease VII large subunit